MSKADWSQECTLAKFYDKPIVAGVDPFSGGIITVGTVISSCIGVSLFGMIYTMWLV